MFSIIFSQNLWGNFLNFYKIKRNKKKFEKILNFYFFKSRKIEFFPDLIRSFNLERILIFFYWKSEYIKIKKIPSFLKHFYYNNFKKFIDLNCYYKNRKTTLKKKKSFDFFHHVCLFIKLLTTIVIFKKIKIYNHQRSSKDSFWVLKSIFLNNISLVYKTVLKFPNANLLGKLVKNGIIKINGKSIKKKPTKIFPKKKIKNNKEKIEHFSQFSKLIFYNNM
jgi:hypothetical protein